MGTECDHLCKLEGKDIQFEAVQDLHCQAIATLKKQVQGMSEQMALQRNASNLVTSAKPFLLTFLVSES